MPRFYRYLVIGALALALAGLAACADTDALVQSGAPTPAAKVMATVTDMATATATEERTAAPTATPTRTATVRPTATPTEAPTATATPTSAPTDTPAPTPTATAAEVAAAAPAAVATVEAAPAAPATANTAWPRLVLANYFVWYDHGTWDSCAVSAGDKPLSRYNSDEDGAIRRHVEQALGAGIDGFTLQWYAPGERTDNNLRKLLAQSGGTSFRSTVVFLRHIWPGSPAPTQDNVAEALAYLVNEYGAHGNYLQVDGRPVIVFADMARVPTVDGQTPLQAWAALRARVDPERRSIWIAEGLDASYLAVFDGLYVYKVSHAAYPDDYVKDSRWAAAVRAQERATGQAKIWMATLTPGWDDTRSGCQPDTRVPSAPHRREREDGAMYRATYAAAVASGADWLWINSFNEWIEGTYIEPSEQYGDRYLQLTGELVGGW